MKLAEILFERFKNEGNNKQVILDAYTSMTEIYLRQPGFIYSASGPFTKKKERIQKFKETGDSGYKPAFIMIWFIKI